MYKRAISTQVWREVVSLSSKTCMQASNMSMEVSGNGCTCNFCINYSLALWPAHACLPLRNISRWGLGTRLTTTLFPGHPQILSHSCVVFVCLLFVCLFFPQLWDTGSGLAMRLASCHPSCAQLYHNVPDILSPSESCITTQFTNFSTQQCRPSSWPVWPVFPHP